MSKKWHVESNDSTIKEKPIFKELSRILGPKAWEGWDFGYGLYYIDREYLCKMKLILVKYQIVM